MEEPMGSTKRCGSQALVERFVYPVMPLNGAAPSVFGLSETIGDDLSAGFQNAASGDDAPLSTDRAKTLAEESRHAFSAGRERGIVDGRQLERESTAAILKNAEDQRKQQLAKMVDEFARERDQYFHVVEEEVVKLALAVAARILRREAQMDPLLLTGAVRVALGQLSRSTEVRVRVPAGEFELWKDALAHLPNLTVKPQVVAGDGMRLGDCMIETTLGSVDLGIRSQLGEIERGFFDNAVRSSAANSEVRSTREVPVTLP